MRCSFFKQKVFALLLIATVTSSVVNAMDDATDIDVAIENAINDPICNDAALEYWQSTLASKGGGVYLHEDVLFFVCKIKFNKSSAASLNKVQREANQVILQKLKDWCQKEADEKFKTIPSSENQRIAWACMDRLSPSWKYEEWAFSGNTRTIVKEPDFNAGVLTVVMTVNEVDARESAKRCKPHCSLADVNSQIARYFKTIPENGEMEVVYKNLGILDLTEPKGVEKETVREYNRLEQSIQKYLAKSSLAKQFRQESAKIAVPTVETNRVETVNPQGTELVIKEEIRTVIRRARMQQLFLSGGTMMNAACARMESGIKAEAIAFDNTQTLDKKLQVLHEALCENPSDAVLWNLYGRCLGDAGDKIAAVICFRNSLKIDPRFEYATVNLSAAYRDLKCPNLSVGLALYARGIARQKWSISQSELLLQ